MKFNLAIVVIALTMIGLTGCNTFKGVGRDIESVGETIQGKYRDK